MIRQKGQVGIRFPSGGGVPRDLYSEDFVSEVTLELLVGFSDQEGGMGRLR